MSPNVGSTTSTPSRFAEGVLAARNEVRDYKLLERGTTVGEGLFGLEERQAGRQCDANRDEFQSNGRLATGRSAFADTRANRAFLTSAPLRVAGDLVREIGLIQEDEARDR